MLYRAEDMEAIFQMSLTAYIELGLIGRITSGKAEDYFAQTVSAIAIRPNPGANKRAAADPLRVQ
jgi:hypothetical protein